MVPEDVGWRFGAVFDDASEVDGAALVHVQVWRPQNFRRWHCNSY